MALIKTTKRSHGPSIVTLELTEAEAVSILLRFEPGDAIYEGLVSVLPPGSAELVANADAPVEDADDGVDG